MHCAGTIGLIDGINPPIGEYLAAGGSVALGSDHVPETTAAICSTK